MVESIVDLHGEVHNAFKRLGHAELCLHAEETDMLKELVMFLKEFEGFTDLISTSGCTTRTSYWTSRLSEGYRAKELSVDPTRQVNVSVFCAEVFIVNWR